MLSCVYGSNCNIYFDQFISILKDITIQYDDIVITGDLNNNILLDIPLIGLMLSLDLVSVNVSKATHYVSALRSLIDLGFEEIQSGLQCPRGQKLEGALELQTRFPHAIDNKSK